jgi:GTP-binding protein YchF
MYRPRKITPATIEYLDLAAVTKGEALDVLPLEQLRTVSALAHVVRAFTDDAVPHSEGPVDPARDVATMETELILADHAIAERRIEKLELLIKKTKRDEDVRELDLLRRCLETLERDEPLRNLELNEEDGKRLRGFTFLSRKPLLIIVNADEADASRLDDGARAFGLEAFEGKPATQIVGMSAKIESEIAQLDFEDAETFRDELGIEEPAIDRMIRASYRLLGRMSFFTVGEDECRAWTIDHGTRAHDAAATIHTDIQRGFIRAEVLHHEDLIVAGNWAACRGAGKIRLEGKDYVVQDGEIVHFRFNV